MRQQPLIVPQPGFTSDTEYLRTVARFLEQLIQQVPFDRGANGTFESTDGKTITVENGIVTKIA